MAKTLIWKEGEKEFKVSFVTDTYVDNDNLYVGLEVHNDDGSTDFFCDITVNIGEKCNADCAFVDDNNIPRMERWLCENGIATPTGNFGLSGFCVYSEFRFDMGKIREFGRKF